MRLSTRFPSRALRQIAAAILLAATSLAAPPPAIAGSKVEQPIEFPHDVHAGRLGISCMYCHTYARRSAVSGIPPLQKCMGCHENIDSVKDKPRVKKLFEYWEARQPIPWKKIYNLPDFVRFNHERHIQRFYFQQGMPVQEACGLCHGAINTMTVAEMATPLTMGWCVSCHEQTPALRPAGTERDGAGKPDSAAVSTAGGPNDCSYCHK